MRTYLSLRQLFRAESNKISPACFASYWPVWCFRYPYWHVLTSRTTLTRRVQQDIPCLFLYLIDPYVSSAEAYWHVWTSRTTLSCRVNKGEPFLTQLLLTRINIAYSSFFMLIRNYWVHSKTVIIKNKSYFFLKFYFHTV